MQLASIDLAIAQTTHPESVAGSLVAVHDADPLELARIAHRVGDAAILALLSSDRPTAVRIAAMRAAPWLREPEYALMPLSASIGLRDSELAEAAARAAWQIARQLDPDVLIRREVLRPELSAVITRLHSVAKQTWVREDIRLLAAATAVQLAAAGVPAEPSAR